MALPWNNYGHRYKVDTNKGEWRGTGVTMLFSLMKYVIGMGCVTSFVLITESACVNSSFYRHRIDCKLSRKYLKEEKKKGKKKGKRGGKKRRNGT